MKIRDIFKEQISTNEGRAELGAIAVFAGLIMEVALAFRFRTHKSFLEEWGPIIADALVALGVYAEIHFGRKASNEASERVASANERAATAIEAASEATERAGKAEQRAAELNKQVIDSERTILDMQKYSLPRRFWTGPKTDPILLEHPNTTVCIYVVNEIEPRRLGRYISGGLCSVGWNVNIFEKTIPCDPLEIDDGVTIFSWGVAGNEVDPLVIKGDRAARALKIVMDEFNLDPRPIYIMRTFEGPKAFGTPLLSEFPKYPMDTLFVSIGIKPADDRADMAVQRMKWGLKPRWPGYDPPGA